MAQCKLGLSSVLVQYWSNQFSFTCSVLFSVCYSILLQECILELHCIAKSSERWARSSENIQNSSYVFANYVVFCQNYLEILRQYLNLLKRFLDIFNDKHIILISTDVSLNFFVPSNKERLKFEALRKLNEERNWKRVISS